MPRSEASSARRYEGEMRRFVPHDGPISAGRPDCVIRVKSQPGRTGKVEPPIGKDKNGVAHLFVAVLFSVVVGTTVPRLRKQSQR
jgi:hypothetical protein